MVRNEFRLSVVIKDPILFVDWTQPFDEGIQGRQNEVYPSIEAADPKSENRNSRLQVISGAVQCSHRIP